MVKRGIATCVLSISMTLLAATGVFAQSGGPGEAKNKAVQDITASSAAESKIDGEVTQLVLVAGDGSGSSQVTVSYYEREDGVWSEIFAVPGYCGYNGISADKKEGDRKTPSGTYNFTMAFGVNEDPGSILPYHHVEAEDYWVDDSDSAYYNRLVNTKTTAPDWDSAEQLIRILPQYYYGLVLDYNSECTPGKGSAIFLHGYHTWKTWTEGCVAIPQENMVQLLQRLKADAKIVIVSDKSEFSF